MCAVDAGGGTRQGRRLPRLSRPQQHHQHKKQQQQQRQHQLFALLLAALCIAECGAWRPRRSEEGLHEEKQQQQPLRRAGARSTIGGVVAPDRLVDAPGASSLLELAASSFGSSAGSRKKGDGDGDGDGGSAAAADTQKLNVPANTSAATAGTEQATQRETQEDDHEASSKVGEQRQGEKEQRQAEQTEQAEKSTEEAEQPGKAAGEADQKEQEAEEPKSVNEPKPLDGEGAGDKTASGEKAAEVIDDTPQADHQTTENKGAAGSDREEVVVASDDDAKRHDDAKTGDPAKEKADLRVGHPDRSAETDVAGPEAANASHDKHDKHGQHGSHDDHHGNQTGHKHEHGQHDSHGEGHDDHDHEEEKAVKAYLDRTFSEPQLEWNAEESKLQTESEMKVGYIVAMFIFAVVIFDSTLLYLLNCSDPQIQSYSYKLISSVLVVFISLGLTNAQHSVIHTWVGHGKNAVVIIDVIMMGLVLFWFAAIRSAAVYFKVDSESRHATLAVVLHVAAFMLFECLGEWQRHVAVVVIGGDDVNTGRPSWSLASHIEGMARSGQTTQVLWAIYVGVPLFAMTLIAVMVQVMARVIPGDPPSPASPRRESTSSGNSQGSRPSLSAVIPGSSPEGGHGHHGSEWEHDAFHAETDVSAIAAGFLLKQLVVFIVLSFKAAPMDCEDNPIECHVGCKKLLMMLGVSLVAHGLATMLSIRGDGRPILSKVQMHLSMLAVWIALQIADMMVVDFMDNYVPASSVVHASTMKKLVTAAVLSPLYIISIIVVDKLADHGLISDVAAEESIVALALLTGLFWEKVADSAIRNFSMEVQAHWSIGLAARLALLAPLIPAWKWYIVPHASLPVPPRTRESDAAALVASAHGGTEVTKGEGRQKEVEEAEQETSRGKPTPVTEVSASTPGAEGKPTRAGTAKADEEGTGAEARTAPPSAPAIAAADADAADPVPARRTSQPGSSSS